jgi:glyoxylate/hydroxypyruvate reductase
MVNEYPDYIDATVWADGLKRRVPGLEFRLWPDAGNKDDIDIVLIDKGAKSGFFDAMTKLRAVIYLGAGVDGIDLNSFPQNVPLIRLATREQTSEVVQYIVLRVLCQQRHVADYMMQQARKSWCPIAPRKTSETRIVVLGAGRIGGWAARLFAELGYDTAVWPVAACGRSREPGLCCVRASPDNRDPRHTECNCLWHHEARRLPRECGQGSACD